MNEEDEDCMIEEEEDMEVVATSEKSQVPTEVDKSKKRKPKKGVFNREWLNIIEYQHFLKEYKSDPSQATCVACNQQFSVHYRGKADIDNHMKTQKHQNSMKAFEINRQLITQTMKPTREKDEVSAAEGVLVYHGVKHAHSYLAQQCLTKVCKTIFPTSLVANNLSCARTKSGSIAVNVLAPYFTYALLDDLKKSFYYCLMYDASNKGNMKVFPFCVQFLSSTGVKKGIVDLIDDADETAIKVSSNAHKLIMDNGLDINGLTALSSDNTNVNVGENHSIYSLFRDELPNLMKGNCYSHIFHNSVKHAHCELSINIEQVLLTIYSHFSRSAKRISELKQYYEFYEQDFKVILKHIKLRWLSLYLSIQRLTEVFVPVKRYFLDQHDDCPMELKTFFELDEATCVLSFLQSVLFDLHKKNLELQRYYTTAVDLFRIISSVKMKLNERIDSEFFGSACRYRLARLPIDTQNILKSSFIKFLTKIISYIDSYFDQNNVFYRTISYFGQENVEALTWNQVVECVEMIHIKDLDEDRLFDEFTNLKSTLRTLLDQPIPLFDQVKAFITKQNNLVTTDAGDEENENEDEDIHLTESKIVRSDQLWMLLLSLTPSPNFKKLLCFLFSLPSSNAYVESVFSQMKHLVNDKRNCMTTELVSAELKKRLNATLQCADMYKYILSNQDILKAIRSDEKYTFKKKNVQ